MEAKRQKTDKNYRLLLECFEVGPNYHLLHKGSAQGVPFMSDSELYSELGNVPEISDLFVKDKEYIDILLEKNNTKLEAILGYAADRDVDFLLWVIDSFENLPFTKAAVVLARKKEFGLIEEHLTKKNVNIRPDELVIELIKQNNLKMLKSLKNLGFNLNPNFTVEALKYCDKIELFLWYKENTEESPDKYKDIIYCGIRSGSDDKFYHALKVLENKYEYKNGHLYHLVQHEQYYVLNDILNKMGQKEFDSNDLIAAIGLITTHLEEKNIEFTKKEPHNPDRNTLLYFEMLVRKMLAGKIAPLAPTGNRFTNLTPVTNNSRW